MRTEKGGISSTSSSSYVDSAIDSPPRHAIWSTERRLAMKPPPGTPVKAPSQTSSSSRGRPYLPNYSPACRRTYYPQQQQKSCSSSSPSSCLSSSSFGDNRRGRGVGGGQRTTSSKSNSMTLILPSKTIDEDDDDDQCRTVSLPFRPTRLSFTDSCDQGDEQIMGDTDPTTVLLGPTSTTTTPGGVLSWHDDDHDDDDGHESVHAMDQDDDDDDDMSPRLFHRFGESTWWRYESIEIAEDESDAIFRSAAVMDNDDNNSGDDFVDNDDDDDNNDHRQEPAPPIQERFTASPMLRGKDDARI